ncbi:MAG TPA: NADH-quinone oxidoreductase subunit J [Lacunisphaera sp.]|nr:NADH-quinone oxidoreductase subunit J [Lacunisphaera sp.]
MTAALIVIGLVMLGSAVAALLRRNLIHSALLLVASWAGVAAFYLWAGAEFVAFAQVLVYVGAISMVVLFAVLLTRQDRVTGFLVEPASRSRGISGVIVGTCLFAVLSAAVFSSDLPEAAETAPSVSVKTLGLTLMRQHGGALLIIGVILTVALLGATILAATDSEGRARIPSAPDSPEDQP